MTMITLNGISNSEYLSFDDLTDTEKNAVNLIKSALTENKIPADILFFRYTSSYLAIESFKTHPFARIKTTGKLWYIELSCGDAKTGKNFQRFEFTDISEINNYKKEIIVAFRFCDPNYFQHHYANVVCDGLDEKLLEFFSFLEVPTEGMIFTPTSYEIDFFASYINKLETAGLNWRNVNLRLLSGRTICARGGCIKFGKKTSYMTYTEPDSIRSIKVKDLTLNEYISLQKYWLADCLCHKDIYEL